MKPIDRSRVQAKKIVTETTAKRPVPTAKNVQPTLKEPEAPRSTVLPPATKPAAQAALVGRVGLHDVKAPTFTFLKAVATASFQAKDPAAIASDPATPAGAAVAKIVDGLTRAKTILVVGHCAPDGDCVGSTLTMQRALEGIGKHVDVCVDADLGGLMRCIDTHGRVQKASAYDGKTWDMVVVFDVAEAKRIGGAARLLKNAREVAVVDHHHVTGAREDLGVAAGVPFTSWIEPDYPCAALMAAAILARFRPQTEAANVDGADAMTPALCGFCTDTGWGGFPGLDREYHRFFKHMLLDDAKIGLDTVRNTLAFTVPKRVDDLLLRDVVPADAPELAGGLREEMLNDKDGKPRIGIITVTQQFLDATLRMGKRDDPRLIEDDIRSHIKWHRQPKLAKRGAALTVTCVEADRGIFWSFRSDGSDLARRMAERLNGGGHGAAAAGRVYGATPAEGRQKLLETAAAIGLLPT